MEKDSPSTIKPEAITCPSCTELNSEADAFCRKCGSPIGALSTLDPLQTIQTEGFLFRKATEGRPQLIVLLGIWIVFLPWLAISVGVAIHIILNERGFGYFFFFWGAVGLAYIGFIILYRTTKNYLTIPKKEQD